MNPSDPAPGATSPENPASWSQLLRRTLTPSAWALIGILVVLGWRLVGWWARQAFSLIEIQPREIAKGVAWDLALVAFLFALARAAALVRAAQGPRIIRRVALASSVGVATVGLLAMLVRGLDAGHCVLGGSHWTSQAFMYLDRGFSGSLLQARTLLAIGGVCAVAGLLALALWRDGRWMARRVAPGLPSLPSRHRQLITWGLLLLTLPPAAWALKDGIAYPAHVHQWRLVPEVNFARRWLESRAEPEVDVQGAGRVPAPTWQSFIDAGLVPAHSLPEDPFPLLQASLDEPPFPHPRRDDAPEKLRPNVVITFMESVNSLFVHELSGRYRGLMPEVSALARKLSRVEAFYNTSSPTIAAMVAVLCSVHPASHPYDLKVGQSVDGRTAYTCLADILRRHGYRTVYVQGASRKVTSKEYFFRTHGFDEVYGLEDIRKRWPKRPRGVWGFYDRDTFAYAADQLRRLEAQQAVDGRPFLLVMLSLDPHEPGMGPKEALPTLMAHAVTPGIAELPEAEDARLQLASYHSSDAAIGDWGRLMLEPERARRTLWLLTSDHTAFRHLVSEAIFLKQPGNRNFDKVPLLIHDPLHRLPTRIATLSGSTDVTPTVLHMLGLVRGLNSFTGRSIFGRRTQLPALVGRIGLRYAWVHNGRAGADLPIGVVRERCKTGRPLIEGGDDPLDACALAAWLDWSDGLWAARRLFPHTAYFGDDGVDKLGLAMKMYLNKAEERTDKRLGAKETRRLRQRALQDLDKGKKESARPPRCWRPAPTRWRGIKATSDPWSGPGGPRCRRGPCSRRPCRCA